MFKETPRLKNEPSSLPKAQALGYTARKPKGPVLENTNHAEVATPTVKRGFVTPKFWGLVRLHRSPMVTGGMGLPARMAARLRARFQHPVHLLRLKTQTVASLIHAGIQTMTATLRAHTAAPTFTQPTTGALDPIQLHADAHNALNMAVFYLRQPDANVPGARRKAVQALAALRNLSLSLEG